jgi:tetratricopeptide (TPR) repeat protein
LSDDITQMAQHAYEIAGREPARALQLGEQVARDAKAARDVAAESLAFQAMGIAARTLGSVQPAVAHLRRAITIAERGGLTRQAARCRVSLGPTLQMAGRGAGALRAFDEAIGDLTGADRAEAEAQRATMLVLAGSPQRALESLRSAIPVLRRSGDSMWVARALSTRAHAATYLGDFHAADRDLAETQGILEAAGDQLNAAGARHNRGWTAGYAGDLVRALQHYDEAEASFDDLGVPVGELALDRASLLLQAGLSDEALRAAERASETLQAAGQDGFRADAMLIASQAALASGNVDAALRNADDARRAFRKLGRHGWMALAGYAAVRARWGAGDFSSRALRLACKTGEELTHARLTGPAVDARLIAGRTALVLGRKQAARRELAAVSAARKRGTAEQRSRGWLAEALLRTEAGQHTSAVRALRAGLDVIDRHRATLGATELRAHASNHATDLATMGQRLAIGSERPAAVLEWTERWRGAALRMPPVRPPDDRELAAELAALREVHADLAKAAAEGESIAGLTRKRAGLEQSVLRRTRRTAGYAGDADAIATPDQLGAALGDRALVELAAVDDRIYGVTLFCGRLRLHPLGDVPPVVAELDNIRFALRRLAYAHGSAASHTAAMRAVTHSGARLDELLIAPMFGAIGDQPLVLIPPGGLHALPWSTLPSCARRDVTIAPSATTWLRCEQSLPPRGKRVVLVAGPRLPGADEEVAMLGELHDKATLLAGSDATAAAVSKAIDGAGLAHIAAHGNFRGDNPLFSSLTLADGPLTVYDMERLRRAPYRVVLSSCDSGLAGVRAGDELMGLAAALFPLGTAGIVASVIPVPDHATRPLMLALHERLIAGDTLSQALAAARGRLDSGDPVQFAAGAAFVALGAA